MSKGGHNRKPSKSKIIQGTFQKDRNPKNELEPEVVCSDPKRPSHLNRYAKKLWKSLVAELVEKGILTVVDQAALEVCCVAFGEFCQAYDAVYRPRDPCPFRLSDLALRLVLCHFYKALEVFPELDSPKTEHELFKEGVGALIDEAQT